MFRNFHFIIAFLVAPFLAIMAWYAADTMLGEKKKRRKKAWAMSFWGFQLPLRKRHLHHE